MSRTYVFAVAAFLAFASAARADKIDMHVNISKADFAAVRSHVIEQMDSDRYAEITQQDKAAVIAALDRIDQRLAKPTRGDQDLVDIYNDQELINQITAHASVESRIWCERDQPTGTHVIRVTCMSLAKWTERERDGQAAANAMALNHRNTCAACTYEGQFPPPGPGH